MALKLLYNPQIPPGIWNIFTYSLSEKAKQVVA